MSKWAKLKKIQTIVKPPEINDIGEEIIEEEPLYTIEKLPEPKYKFKFFRSVNYFQRNTHFQDNEAKVCEEILPCLEMRKKFMKKQPYDKSVGSHTPISHSDMNTSNKQTTVSGMNHVEGGWPEHVKPDILEHRNKFIRQTCKEDMFKWTTTRLMKNVEKVLQQNNVMDIEELYFLDLEDNSESSTLTTKTLARFKDNSGRRRPVGCLAWKHSKVEICFKYSLRTDFSFITLGY
jgi:hypothetical protein